MIEFEDDFSRIYTGKQAVQKRVSTRLKHTLNDIPYYNRCVDFREFVYDDIGDAIRMAFRDMDATVESDGYGVSRIQVYGVSIPIEE
ncbi:MAG: hypothetical protein J6Y78_09770 [Paludibacteraceae bacterium]|nr:hypothetical protein [Paludibacteraceae bacterium]